MLVIVKVFVGISAAGKELHDLQFTLCRYSICSSGKSVGTWGL